MNAITGELMPPPPIKPVFMKVYYLLHVVRLLEPVRSRIWSIGFPSRCEQRRGSCFDLRQPPILISLGLAGLGTVRFGTGRALRAETPVGRCSCCFCWVKSHGADFTQSSERIRRKTDGQHRGLFVNAGMRG